MARKTLLTEAEIRQFMKLANLAPLGAAKIDEMYGTPPGNRDKEDHKKEMTEADEDEEGKEDVHEKPVAEEVEELDEMGMKVYDRDEDEVMAGEESPEDDMGAPMDDPLDEPADELGADDEMGADLGGMDDAGREELMADVVLAVAQALGIEDQVSVEAGEDDGMEGGDDLDADMPAMDPMDEPAADEPEMAMGGEEDEEVDVMAEDNEDDLVAEVARRVAARLQTQNRKEQMVDALAERIMKRLTK